MGGGHGQHALERLVLVNDVGVGAQVGRFVPSLLRGSEEDGLGVLLDDGEAEAALFHGNHGRRQVDDGPHGGVLGAVDLVVGDQRAQPVEQVQDFSAGHARIEILVAAAETHDLMGKHGPDDADQVIVQHPAVQGNVDGFAHEPA